MGTTRPVRPGWRADSSTTSGRSAVSARIAVQLGGEARLGRPEVEPGQRVERLAQGAALAATSADSSSRMRSTSSCLGDLRLAPGVAQLDDDERLDEQRLAAARGVVDDALDPRPRVGPDRHDVAAVAQRDDRLLERAAELRADERVEPPAQPVVGDPDRRPQAAQPRRGRVEQLARPDRSCGPACSGAPGRAWRSRPRSRRSGRRSSARAVASRAAASSVSAISRNWAGSSRPPRAARSIDGPMSWAAPMPTPGRSLSSARAWSVSSRPRATMTGSSRTARAPRPGGATARTRSPRRAARGRAGTPGGRSSAASIAVSRRTRRGRRPPGRREDEAPRAA